MVMTAPRHLYLVALGSNLGDRARLLDGAAAEIAARLGEVVARSPAYETEPMGAADQPFLNAALVLRSPEAPEAVLAALLAIEAQLGRVRRERWGNRTIDLDLLLWRPDGQEGGTWESATLRLPHPEMLKRDFVLVPACDVAADWLHPGTHRTLAAETAARGYGLKPASASPPAPRSSRREP